MPPGKFKHQNTSVFVQVKAFKKESVRLLKRWGNWKGITLLMQSSEYTNIVACFIILTELLINIFIINSVKYTEIDWRAYMQEVEGFLNGEFNYSKLQGDTGPLVYPAGFVYIFSAFYHVTNNGENVRLAQYIFAVIYLLNLALVFRIYSKSKKVPPYMLVFISFTSYRVHSIFVLRMFNDPVAVFLFFIALNLFLDDKWSMGSVFFSLAVSVKMNILLYAPALLLAYLATQGLLGTVKQLMICALVQVIPATPFLLTDPVSYIRNAFDLGRVFVHKWTVNWRFLPEDVFINPYFHVSLLILHVITLLSFAYYWWRCLSNYQKLKQTGVPIASQLFILPFFVSNFIGMAFSRSLHYQFYVWYFYSLPYLLWTTPYSVRVKLIILGAIELCWNTYPSTDVSSAVLHLCHFAILAGLYHSSIQKGDYKAPSSSEMKVKNKKAN